MYRVIVKTMGTTDIIEFFYFLKSVLKDETDTQPKEKSSE